MRIIISILLCYYLTATIGISSAIHSCGGHYAGVTFWELFGNNRCACPKDEHKKDNNCCKEKYSFCKIKAEHSSSTYFLSQISLGLYTIPNIFYISPSHNIHIAEKEIPHNHAPPNADDTPVYLVYRKILI